MTNDKKKRVDARRGLLESRAARARARESSLKASHKYRPTLMHMKSRGRGEGIFPDSGIVSHRNNVARVATFAIPLPDFLHYHFNFRACQSHDAAAANIAAADENTNQNPITRRPARRFRQRAACPRRALNIDRGAARGHAIVCRANYCTRADRPRRAARDSWHRRAIPRVPL